MFEIKGKYGNCKVFANHVEQEAISQIHEFLNQEISAEQKVRIMPDCHAGKGCTVGFTTTITDKVIPNLVGVDIGCGVFTAKIPSAEIDLENLDSVIRKHVPSGFHVNGYPLKEANNFFEKKESIGYLYPSKNKLRHLLSLGTLGGGNHFIEVGRSESTGGLYLIIHSGSRGFGKEVAEYYQKIAEKKLEDLASSEQKLKIQEIIEDLKKSGREQEIESVIKSVRQVETKIPKDLAYLSGDDMDKYLKSMEVAQAYAALNRKLICETIFNNMGWILDLSECFDTVHNYIDHESKILRKGAVSAKLGEKLLIPINMRDGSLVCKGLGNKDWNESAPHGAGRLMSRSKAKEILSMDEFQKEMKDVYTTSVSENTLDESPMAYKPLQDIIDVIGDTVIVEDRLIPVYNFKA